MTAREPIMPRTRGFDTRPRIHRVCAGALLMSALAPCMTSAETLEGLDVAGKSLEQADENCLTRNPYRAGTWTKTEVLDAEARHQRAYVSFYSARYDAVFAHLRLKRAAGVLG